MKKKKGYLKRMGESLRYLFIFGLLAWLTALTQYWIFKAYVQFFKIVFRIFKIKYPFNFKKRYYDLIIGYVIILCQLLFNLNNLSEILVYILGGIFVLSSLDKLILQNEKVCNVLNDNRTWCD